MMRIFSHSSPLALSIYGRLLLQWTPTTSFRAVSSRFQTRRSPFDMRSLADRPDLPRSVRRRLLLWRVSGQSYRMQTSIQLLVLVAYGPLHVLQRRLHDHLHRPTRLPHHGVSAGHATTRGQCSHFGFFWKKIRPNLEKIDKFSSKT